MSGDTRVYFIDPDAPGIPTLVASVDGRVYNAELHAGAYYYIPNNTTDLLKINLAADGTAVGKGR